MPKRFGSIVLVLALLVSSPARIVASTGVPPATPAEPVTDNYFGTIVVDPYRWMERGASDPRFLPLLKAQNAFMASLLAPLAGPRDALKARLLSASKSVAGPYGWKRAGGRFFYQEVRTTQDVSVLRVREPDGVTRTLFDPSTFASGTSHAAITYQQPSIDGSHVAVGVALGGSEETTTRILDVRTGALLPDAISRTNQGAPSWRDDGSSFYYARDRQVATGSEAYAKLENMRVYLHVLGTDPEHDPAVFGPGLASSPGLPVSGVNSVNTLTGTPYLIGTNGSGTSLPPTVYVSRNGGAAWTKMIARSEQFAPPYSGSSQFATRGSKLFVLLQNVPNRRIVSYDLSDSKGKPVVVVPESSRVIEGVFATSNSLYVEYRDGLHLSLQKLSDSGKMLGEVPLPFAGAVWSIDASPTEPNIRFGMDSWTHVAGLFAFDEKTGTVSDTGLIQKNPYDTSHLAAREVMVPSTDGASVPVSIITRDDVALDGSHPTIVEAYGAYGVSIDPFFSPTQLEWARRGGVFAWAHARGGGEYGESWHVAGQKANKQHTADDMIAAAHYLIDKKYTSPRHLALRGTSGGGIPVGVALIQHPELFAVAVENVGMTNLLRQQTRWNGPANIPEVGDVTKVTDFAYIFPMDAYVHVKDGVPYPAFIGIVGANDPRGFAWILEKMVSRLQAASSSGKPVVLRTDFDAGHGFDSRTQAVDETADEWTFLLWQLGDPEFQPK
jgi:prolyl oligopeptidase